MNFKVFSIAIRNAYIADGGNFRGKRIVAAVNSPFSAELFISGEGLQEKVGASKEARWKYESGYVSRWNIVDSGPGTSNQLSACYLPAFDSFAIFCPLAHSFVRGFWGRRFLRGLL